MNTSYRMRNGPAAFQHDSSAFYASPQVWGNGDAGPFSPRRGRIFPVFAPVQVTLSDRSHRQSSVLSSDLILFCCCEKVLRAARSAENTSRRQHGKSHCIHHGGWKASSALRRLLQLPQSYKKKKGRQVWALCFSCFEIKAKKKASKFKTRNLIFLQKKQLRRWHKHAKRFFYLRTSAWSVFIKLCPVNGRRLRERFLFPQMALAVAWRQHLWRRNPEPCDWTGPFH